MSDDYPAPVSALLTRGEPNDMNEWADYTGEYGFQPEHVPELVRLMNDGSVYDEDPDGPKPWAPVHAWRALAQLGAGEAAGPLVSRLDNEEDEWARRDMPRAMGMIGAPAVPALAGFISDSSHDEYARGRAVESLKAVVDAHPDARDAAVGILKPQLDRYRENGGVLNGEVIKALIELGERDAATVMVRAYNEHLVDSDVVHWDEIQEFAGASPGSA